MEQGFQLRDVYNPVVVERLAENITRVYTAFDKEKFCLTIIDQLPTLSFGARSNLIRDTLWQFLPKEFPQAVQILVTALGPEIQECELTGFDGFVVMSENDFVAKYGIEYFELSMQALYEMTKRFTAEGAIRPFLMRYPEETLAILEHWADDENCHVRRLVSEGTRPRLPMASRLQQFIKDPRPLIRLLEKLKADPSLMVRRSVANNLNDIAKDNPEVVVDTLREWQKTKDPGTQWIIGHATRTLVKQGHKGALALLGFAEQIYLNVENLRIESSTVRIGDLLPFEFEITSTADEAQKLVIDYIIHYRKANGKLAPKVFKLTKKVLAPRETISIRKTHPFRVIGIRPFYPGRHELEIQINGQPCGRVAFDLSPQGNEHVQ